MSKVSKAIKDILDFQEEKNTTVRMAKVIARPLKQHLSLKYQIGPGELANMELGDLFNIIAQETQVYSSANFYKELKEAMSHVKLMNWKYVSPVNHEVFYFQQLRLIEEFGRLLKIMLIHNKMTKKVD